MSLAVARVSTVLNFGLFSIGLTVLTVSLTLSRGLLGSRIVLASPNEGQVRTESRQAAGAALILGLVIACLMALLGALTAASNAVLALALVAPFLLVQDVGRFFCLASGRPLHAVRADGMWTVGSLVIFLATLITPRSIDSFGVVALWGVLGVFAMFLVLWPTRLAPTIRGIRGWAMHNLGDRLRYGTEALVASATSLAIVGVASLMVGPSAVGALRGANALLGPLAVLGSSIPIAVVPELRRRNALDAESIWPLFRKLVLPMSAAALLIGAVGSILPNGVGEVLLGPTWLVAQPVLPFTAFEYAAVAWVAAAFGCLRVQGRSVALLQVRLLLATLSIGFVITLASVVNTAAGIAAGLACAAVVTALVGRFIVFHGAVRQSDLAGVTKAGDISN